MNFHLAPTWLHDVLRDVVAQGEADYGRLGFGDGERVQIEFVSANPTGPIHVGNGWFASYGDSLGRIMTRCGYDVSRDGQRFLLLKPRDRRPDVLAQGQKVAATKLGLSADAKPFDFVFHGGSGSELCDIHKALDFGVVKMNVDTDMQYAFTRAVADHCFRNYDGILKVDGEVGNKKVYDPRSYLALGETAMAERVKQIVKNLRGTGTTMAKSGVVVRA